MRYKRIGYNLNVMSSPRLCILLVLFRVHLSYRDDKIV